MPAYVAAPPAFFLHLGGLVGQELLLVPGLLLFGDLHGLQALHAVILDVLPHHSRVVGEH